VLKVLNYGEERPGEKVAGAATIIEIAEIFTDLKMRKLYPNLHDLKDTKRYQEILEALHLQLYPFEFKEKTA
jgi:hypothetical protein